jgi:hypothetical protein
LKFNPQTWKCEGGIDHVVVEVAFEQQDIATATAVADAKVNYINVHSPGGIRRSPAVIRNRIIAGKLADAAVFRLIRHRIRVENLEQVFSVLEYDAVRADGFQYADPFDLELCRYGQPASETIEVRSSFSYRLAPAENIVKKLSIYGWYTSYNKPVEPPRDWYWQVIFYLRPQDIPQDDGPNVGVFEEELAKGTVTAYVVGGASRALLESKGVTRKDQDDAFYQAITPICGGSDYWGMVTGMLGVSKPM